MEKLTYTEGLIFDIRNKIMQLIETKAGHEHCVPREEDMYYKMSLANQVVQLETIIKFAKLISIEDKNEKEYVLSSILEIKEELSKKISNCIEGEKIKLELVELLKSMYN